MFPSKSVWVWVCMLVNTYGAYTVCIHKNICVCTVYNIYLFILVKQCFFINTVKI